MPGLQTIETSQLTDPRVELLTTPGAWALARANGDAPTDLCGLNLRGAQLSGLDLVEVDLRGAILDGAQLENVLLSGARLQGASMREVNATCADLFKADLTGADLSGAQLNAATLRYARLDKIHGEGVRFDGADLTHASLVEAELRDASFTEATATGCLFTGADLRGAELTSAETDCDYATAWQCGDGLFVYQEHHGRAPDEVPTPAPEAVEPPAPAIDLGVARGYFEGLVIQLEDAEARAHEYATELNQARIKLADTEGNRIKRLADTRRMLYARLDAAVAEAKAENQALIASARSEAEMAREALRDHIVRAEALETQQSEQLDLACARNVELTNALTQSKESEAKAFARAELLAERLADTEGLRLRSERQGEDLRARVAAITAERDASVAMLERQLRTAVEKAEHAHDLLNDAREELAEIEARRQGQLETLTARFEAVRVDQRLALADAERHAEVLVTAASAGAMGDAADRFARQGALSNTQAMGLVTLGAGLALTLASFSSALNLHGIGAVIAAAGTATWFMARRGARAAHQAERQQAVTAQVGVWKKA